MKHLLLPIAIIANLAMTTFITEATPEVVKRASTSISELATFDDLTANPVPSLSTIPDPYHDLGLVYLYNMKDTLTALQPHSPPNYAASGPATEYPGIVFFTNINTNATSFDVQSFYFGCLVAADPLLSTACSIQVTAYQAVSGVDLGSTSFEFSPSSLTNATMVQASFGSLFLGLEQVVVNLTESAATVTDTLLLIDSIEYVVHVP